MNNDSLEKMYHNIFDGHISLKDFKRWMNTQLSEAYNKGVQDTLDEPTYDDVSKSQYD